MGNIQKILILLVCFAMSALDNPRASTGPDVKIDDSRVYVGDIYSNIITVSWIGSPSEKAPKYLKYEQTKGRSVHQIQRKDIVSYSNAGKPRSGETIFTVSIRAFAASDSNKTKIVLVYTEASPGVPVETSLSANEPVIHKKIFNIFKLSEFVLLIIVITGLCFAILFLIKHLRKQSEKRNKELMKETDKDLYELNSIGRLIDKKEIPVFINQANSFIEKNIQHLRSNEQNGSNDNLIFITDVELKRCIMKVRQTLYNARFGGYQPDIDEMEEIYQACKSLFEFRKSKKPKNK